MILELPDTIDLQTPILVSIGDLSTLHKKATLSKLAEEAALADAQAANDQKRIAEQTVQRLEDEVVALKKKLEDALKPPPVIVPPAPPVPPVPPRVDVWKDEPAFDVKSIIGATIENSMTSPSSTQYTAVKRAADALEALGINTVRFYLGPMELFGHLDPEGHMFGKFGNLVDYVREKKMHFIADGFDKVMDLLKDDKALRFHVEGLKLLCTWALCWNDADKESPEKLKADVKRVRAAGWTGPTIFSMRGTADLSLYDIPGVFKEFQTFGSDAEFEEIYAVSDADLLCLDTRLPQTKQQIEHIFDVSLKEEIGRPRGYFLYTSKTRDWASTPADEVAEIRDFTKRAKALDLA